MIFIGASLDTIKTCAFITSVPVMFVMMVMLYGWLKWMKKDYGRKTSLEMEETLLKEMAEDFEDSDKIEEAEEVLEPVEVVESID